MSNTGRIGATNELLQPLYAARQACEVASKLVDVIDAFLSLWERVDVRATAGARHEDAFALQLADGVVNRDLGNAVCLAKFTERGQLRADLVLTVPHREVITWITKRSRPVDDLNDTATTRQVLKAISLKLDGSPAAAKTANRKRAAFSSAIGYALELGLLDSNPLQRVKVKRAAVAEELDTRVVVNHRQAKRLLAAVRASDPDFEAFFGCIYYSAMRPAEVRNLNELDLTLPVNGWGEARLAGSYQDPGKDWTDDGELGEERGLKHRARNSTRPVPLPPPLVKLLRHHLRKFGTGPDGRLFVVRAGKWGHALPTSLSRPVPLSAVGSVMKNARAVAFTDEEQNSPLARRAYDLRHAAVSTWLAAGTPPPLVAKWAGHSVQVLLPVYAHAVDGQEEAARMRIEQALADDDEAA